MLKLMAAASVLGILSVLNVTSNQPSATPLSPNMVACAKCEDCFTWPWQNDEHKTTGTSGDYLGPPHGCLSGDCGVHVGCNPQFAAAKGRMLTPEETVDAWRRFEDDLVEAAEGGLRTAVEFARQNPDRVRWNSTRQALQALACDSTSLMAHIPVGPRSQVLGED